MSVFLFNCFVEEEGSIFFFVDQKKSFISLTAMIIHGWLDTSAITFLERFAFWNNYTVITSTLFTFSRLSSTVSIGKIYSKHKFSPGIIKSVCGEISLCFVMDMGFYSHGLLMLLYIYFLQNENHLFWQMLVLGCPPKPAWFFFSGYSHKTMRFILCCFDKHKPTVARFRNNYVCTSIFHGWWIYRS